MRVNGMTANGALRTRLWCEHKLDAKWQPDQVRRYQTAHDSASGAGKVVCIVKPKPPFDCEFITWQGFAEICDRVGRQWGDRNWTGRARESDAPAKWRMLAELVWYLEDKEKLAMVEPLDARKLEVFSALVDAMRSLGALVDTAADRVPGLSHEGWGEEGQAETLTVSFHPPAASWLARYPENAYPDLVVGARDYWSPQQLAQPVVGAGVSVHGRKVFAELSANRGWVDAILAAGYSCEIWEGWARVYRTRPAYDIIEFGDSLDAQADGLAAWSADAITAVLALDPAAYFNDDADADDTGDAALQALGGTDENEQSPSQRASRHDRDPRGKP